MAIKVPILKAEMVDRAKRLAERSIAPVHSFNGHAFNHHNKSRENERRMRQLFRNGISPPSENLPPTCGGLSRAPG